MPWELARTVSDMIDDYRIAEPTARRCRMPRFVLMTRLSPESVRDAEVRREAGRAWLSKVKKACPEVRWISHYAILGPYDFMDIYDAPNEEVAHKVSLISRMEGAVTAESWQALPYEGFLELLAQVE
jgi:uncharacterized protein with GYD domain